MILIVILAWLQSILLVVLAFIIYLSKAFETTSTRSGVRGQGQVALFEVSAERHNANKGIGNTCVKLFSNCKWQRQIFQKHGLRSFRH